MQKTTQENNNEKNVKKCKKNVKMFINKEQNITPSLRKANNCFWVIKNNFFVHKYILYVCSMMCVK